MFSGHPHLAFTRAAAAAAVAITALAASGAAQAELVGLGSAYGLVSFADFNGQGSSISGGAAVGGKATLNGYSIQPAAGGAAALVVAGDLHFANGSVAGDTRVGGALTSSYGGSFGGAVAVGGALDATAGLSVPSAMSTTVWGSTRGLQPWYPAVIRGSGDFDLGVDFDALHAHVEALSGLLAATTATGSAVDQWGTLWFDVTGQTLAVFEIDAGDALKNMRITGLADDATVIINVRGGAIDFGNHGYDGFAPGRVLFNLPDADTLVFNGGVTASLLAPTAAVQPGWGRIQGQVVVGSWNSSVAIRSVGFEGSLPAPAVSAVPEPSSLALMLLGGLGLWASVRRRRAG